MGFHTSKLVIILTLISLKILTRPEELSHSLWCNSCQAIVTEALKHIRESKKEIDVRLKDRLRHGKHLFCK